MCGILATLAGEHNFHLIAHRGTRTRTYTSQKGIISHARLPIVGVGEEHDQPLFRGQWAIAFVGEILNFREIDPEAKCDAPLVADVWSEEGSICFRKFDGFWSVVALCESTGELHILCDYLAQKPMYYRTDFPSAASELDAVAAVGPTTIDEVYMSSVVKWGYCPDTVRTPYEQVKRVLPGELVVLNRGGLIRKRVVDPLMAYPRERLRDEVERAVRRRLLSSDVPVAALVSGGLDSSIVFGLAKRYGDLKPYYVEDGRGNQAERAAVNAVVEGYQLSVLPPSRTSVPLSEAVAIMQEPVDLGSLIPQIALSRAVEERVCLTGDGADEFFGGYSRAWRYDSQASDVWQELVAWHLPRLDRVMMRERVEVRSPFLGRWVAGCALNMPWEERNGGKAVLYEMFEDVLPREVTLLGKIPLRTKVVESNREANSKKMVDIFREQWRDRCQGKTGWVQSRGLGEPQSA